MSKSNGYSIWRAWRYNLPTFWLIKIFKWTFCNLKRVQSINSFTVDTKGRSSLKVRGIGFWAISSNQIHQDKKRDAVESQMKIWVPVAICYSVQELGVGDATAWVLRIRKSKENVKAITHWLLGGVKRGNAITRKKKQLESVLADVYMEEIHW